MPPTSTAPVVDRVRAAAFRARRIVSNATIDLRYGSVLAFDRQSSNGLVSSRNSDYAALEQIFGSHIQPDDVLVDVGSATGRVINFWLDQGHKNRIVGLEFNPEVAERARRRLARHANVSIITGDATQLLPEDGTLFYVYNPFEADVMRVFRDRLAELPVIGTRRLMLYYNCKYIELFEKDDRFTVETVELDAPRYAPLSPLAIISQT